MFRRDLVTQVENFHHFRRELGELEIVNKPVPDEEIAQTKQVPLRAENYPQGTIQGNIDALVAFLRQSGLGDIPGLRNIAEYVVLVHGDLLTGERIHQIQASRSIKDSPSVQFWSLIFVMGLFHLKMACADAIWKIFLMPSSSRDDPNLLINHIAQIRPRDTGTFTSKTGPGFRRMHEVIQHIGTVSRVDSQAVQYASLEDWAVSNPSWDDVVKLSYELARNNVADRQFHRNTLNALPIALRNQE
ncbi:hypothetical protein PUNSTDRAFT_75102 [Punctularia strigosozonata HHB-11173 SS5]|uniref:DUF6589 domain-containing protein n=1 Tax=Punctularia strigosozonata (strain HHB-11173) TaxID=741275 RepID=R7S5K7_PUNST|nr:uncharacterized protein PUNSTDRAFT_75102 [Punctularia strigosozonata HHB-11173 SS5]EIN05242.1 hypothetical protein PUNSTDRAFT_75102 [Punctularia strigosozonata HHB-11173 SS5]